MAMISWPSTLPNPEASGFSFAPKRMGDVLTFASGRKRITCNRMLPTDPSAAPGLFGLNLFLFNVNLSFNFTLAEYKIFATFYDTYWKTLTPQEDRVSFAIGGLGWEGWPTSSVKCVRNANSWKVSFDFECFVDYEPFTFTADESDAVSPLWPISEFPFYEGAGFSRISRDSADSGEYFLLSRITVPDDNFVLGEVSTKPAPIANVLRLVAWWIRYCRAGALPFKLPTSAIDLGIVNGFDPSAELFYRGRLLTPPKVSFDGYFGTASMSVVLYPNVDSLAVVVEIAGDTGDIFASDTGDTFQGVF